MAFDRGGMDIWEHVDSRASDEQLDSATITFKYIVRGTKNDIVAKNYLIMKTSALYDGMRRESASIKNLGYDSNTSDWWEGTVKYSWKKNDRDDENWPLPVYSFDTSGGMFKITHSIETKEKISATGEQAPDFDGGIHVSKDKIDGVDVVIPKLGFSETHHVPFSTVTGSFVKDLARATGKTNSDVFRTFAAGELLFLGCSGTKGDTDVTLQYKFEASQNMENQKVGSVTIESKQGHDYVWTYFSDQQDSLSGLTVNKLRAVYVEKIYESISFSEVLKLADHTNQDDRGGGIKNPPEEPAGGDGGGE